MAEVKTKTPAIGFKRRKQLEKDLEHVTQEMYVKNLELVHTNQTLSLLRTIDSLVLESQESLDQLCQQISGAIIENSDFVIAGVLVKSPHRDQLDLMGVTADTPEPGTAKKLLTGAYVDAAEKEVNANPPGMLLQLEHMSDHRLSALLNVPESAVANLRKAVKIGSIFVARLMARNRLVGVIMVGWGSVVAAVAKEDQVLLERLNQAVGVAIDNRLLYEENQRVLKQLQKSNTKLKALDEAKDEFISMASHQLRTPLTSVKGYVSMVLEGDMGKVSASQRKMLDQAFVSSQRMVYLIADLLNVSRLRTGKFVIEAKPTDLSEVIEQEISQLVETAKGRDLTLTYKKPKGFPVLMLDETKIRQVIMNFADNAIYYTPAGGHIEVKLEDKGQTIEFTVNDDGLGVPKAEQPHLFTKFFRAGNAKKARPDGTGLGLFMAKKVIVAQGGALVFKSAEGKGSTFGFSFAKAKLKPTAAQLKGGGNEPIQAPAGNPATEPTLAPPPIVPAKS